MVKQSLLLLSGLLAASLPASADIKVDFKLADPPKEISVIRSTIKAGENGKPTTENSTVAVKYGTAIIPTSMTEACTFTIVAGSSRFSLYALPSENINVDVTSLKPLSYKASGTALMESVNSVKDATAPLTSAIQKAMQAENRDDAEIDSLMNQYYSTLAGIVKANPGSDAAVYAMMQLNADGILENYPAVAANAAQTTLFPIAERLYSQTKARAESDAARKAMADNHEIAPDFTLKDLAGKDVSLSDFKGKWVILDFWGGWCKWCVKGIPDMKAVYKEYAPRLEIIGIDCNESEEAWRTAVKRYELPWVNVYNPKGGEVTKLYHVPGYPTKAIIDPEGRVAAIVVGESPAFYERLAELMK